MRNEIQLFENGEFGQIRTVEVNEKIMFIGIDVAKSLGYSNASKAISMHCKNGTKVTLEAPSQNGNVVKTQTTLIPEGDIYRLIVKSKLPSAEKFEKWVFEDVLPTVRRHGMYATEETIDKMLGNPDFTIKLLTEYKNEKEARRLAEEKVGTFLDTKNLMEWNVVAKNLGIGRNDMLKTLRKEKILQTEMYIKNGKTKYGVNHNTPYQKYMKYFKIRYIIKGSKRYPKVLVTAIGQEYLYKRLIKNVHENIA